MQPIRTERLELIPATLAVISADMESPDALSRLLDADVPASWPPGEYDRTAMEFFRARLEDGGPVGWYGWYAVQHPTETTRAVLVGTGGFLGPPGRDGVVEVGYSIAPEFRGRGYARELLQALVIRAFSAPGVVRIVAHTTPANRASIKVLERSGFTLLGAGHEPGTVRYQASRPFLQDVRK